MVEPIMFFGIGFLVASLIGLVFIPLVHGRAVRLTMRRLEASTPITMAEIQADKDQLRAEFAMATRRLEMTVDQLKAKTTSQLAEIGTKTDAINRLKLELEEKTAAAQAFEERERALQEHVQAQAAESSAQVAESGAAAESAEVPAAGAPAAASTDSRTALAHLAETLSARPAPSDSDRIELAALRTEIDTLHARIEDYDRLVKEMQGGLERRRGEAETAAQMLAQERGHGAGLGNRVDELERELMAQKADAELLGRHALDLEGRLAERDGETTTLRTALTAARKLETDLRAEIAGLQKDGEESRAAQHERALLRDRLTGVAAEVARLTLTLEGPGSPIASILEADAPGRPNGGAHMNGDGNGHAAADTGGDGGDTLADRIRALQSRAARVPSPT